MTTKSFASQLRDIVITIRDKQHIADIKCDNLIDYLDEVIKSPDEELSQVSLERYKAELQIWVEQNKDAHVSRIEMFRSVITVGQNALRTAFLMNGGATIALLAFLGKLSEEHQDRIPIFANSLIVFVFGVSLIGLASGFTYFSQMFYASNKPWCYKLGLLLHMFVILLGLSSYGFFVWGSIRAYWAFIYFA